MQTRPIYVTTQNNLEHYAQELMTETELAIDLECENNLHHYGMYISLVQVATRKKQYVFDIIALQTLGKLQDILESDSILKVFHDVSFDLRILSYQFDCHPQYVRDTKLAATFLKKEHIGLKELLAEYFSIEKKKKFQMADWTERPLKPGMLDYAASDTTYLLSLYDKLKAELQTRDHYEWFKVECQHIEHEVWNQKIPTFRDMKGFKKFSDAEQTLVETLYLYREELAELADKPPHFIFSNKQLLEFAKNPPQKVSEWKTMQRVHPLVKRKAKEFVRRIQHAKKNVKHFTSKTPKRYSLAQRNHFAKLNRAREQAAEQTGLFPFLILSKDQMQHIVLEETFDSLRPWQEELIAKYL